MSFTQSAKAMINQMDDADRAKKERELELLKLERDELITAIRKNGMTFERMARLTPQENAAVASSFSATVNAMNKEIAEAQALRNRKTGTHNDSVSIRRRPVSSSATIRSLKYPTMVELDGWTQGEDIRNNDIWYRVKGGGWIWSGMFDAENRHQGGLVELPFPTEPEPKPRGMRAERYSEGEQKRLFEVALEHGPTCSCDTCQDARMEAQRVLVERGLGPSFPITKPTDFKPLRENPYAREERRNIEKEIERKKAANAFSDLLPSTPLVQRLMSLNPEEERLRQANMAYAVGPHTWFGWRVLVDRHDGHRQEFWRPTKASAERTGHKALERYVMRRRRLWDAANPKRVTARDRWIVEPTQAEQFAKEADEWDAQFKGDEEGKK